MNELSICEQISKLLSHKITLDTFYKCFFTTEACDIECEIVYDIKLLFAEYSNNDWNEQEMYEMLKDLLEHVTIGDIPSIQVETGTSSVTIREQYNVQ